MKLPDNFGGTAHSQFEKVDQAFRKNFEDGWEAEGAAFAVYYKGDLVVDLWGGYADKSSLRKWQEHTISVCFSSGKGLCSLAVAKLVDDGRLDYDDLVTKYWPEFGAKGKENVTVRQLISHQAGLAVLNEDITPEHIRDWRLMAPLFERQTPNWTIDTTQHGYHAITHGFLCEQLVRRADSKCRSIGQYINDELIQTTGSESFYLGLPISEQYRVTRLSEAGWGDRLYHASRNKELAKMAWRLTTRQAPPLFMQSFSQPRFMFEYMVGLFSKHLTYIIPRDQSLPTAQLKHKEVNTFNDPDIHRLEIGSATGIGTARGLAQPFSALARGELLSPELLDRIKQPLTVDQADKVLGLKVSMGHGFSYSPKPKAPGEWLIGHPGFGGQNVKCDLANELAFAYVTNSLKTGMGDHVRTFLRLQTALYECL